DIATVRYPAVDTQPAKDGLLLYIKPCLCGSESLDVMQYAEQDTLFPQHPTSNQFFDDAQFETYRELGHNIVQSMVQQDTRSVAEWFAMLIRSERREHGRLPHEVVSRV